MYIVVGRDSCTVEVFDDSDGSTETVTEQELSEAKALGLDIRDRQALEARILLLDGVWCRVTRDCSELCSCYAVRDGVSFRPAAYGIRIIRDFGLCPRPGESATKKMMLVMDDCVSADDINHIPNSVTLDVSKMEDPSEIYRTDFWFAEKLSCNVYDMPDRYATECAMLVWLGHLSGDGWKFCLTKENDSEFVRRHGQQLLNADIGVADLLEGKHFNSVMVMWRSVVNRLRWGIREFTALCSYRMHGGTDAQLLERFESIVKESGCTLEV